MGLIEDSLDSADNAPVSLHAFVDESRRRDTYFLAAAVIDPGEVAVLRKLLRGLLFVGQRELHFKKEKPERRKAVLSKLVECGPVVHVYQRDCADSEERARQACLVRMLDDLLDMRLRRLVLDSREERNLHDAQTIRAALGKRPSHSEVVYEHMVSTQEQLLWIADVAAWCAGAGGDWARRVRPLIAKTVVLPDWP